MILERSNNWTIFILFIKYNKSLKKSDVELTYIMIIIIKKKKKRVFLCIILLKSLFLLEI